MVDDAQIQYRTAPSGLWLPCGSATLLAIISGIALIVASSISRGWTSGLSIVLAILGLVVALVTINGWQDWRLFRDTAVQSPGKLIQRIHKEEKDSYGDTTHRYFLVVQFMNGETTVKLRVEVDKTRHSKTREGSTLIVRFAPSKPELALFPWE